MEYTSLPRLLSIEVIEGGGANVDVLCPPSELQGILRLILPEKTVRILADMTSVEEGTVYDLIVCQPPIGDSSARADHFGGDIVRRLSAFLSDRGLIYWMTARSVLFTPKGSQALSRLAASGLHAVAAIEFPVAALQGVSIEGALIVLGREDIGRRLVGAVRDTATAQQVASALLRGPSQKVAHMDVAGR